MNKTAEELGHYLSGVLENIPELEGYEKERAILLSLHFINLISLKLK